MKLVVGLGNPGRRYQQTRHNVGYTVVAELARRFGTGAAKEKFRGEVVEADVHGERILLLAPITFMNRSGSSVQEACGFYKLPHQDLLVVCDDLNLPVTRLRLRPSGSAGGQKGLEDIIRCLGTEDFPRLRIGIGPAPPGWVWTDFVLSKFTPDEAGLMEQAVQRAADAVVSWARDGIEAAMNRYNQGA